MTCTTVCILNQKGGAGKTTMATVIARQLQLQDQRVLLVDGDPQGSARDWREANEDSPLTVVGLDRTTLPRDLIDFKANYDWIVVDGAPQAHDLAVAAIKSADVVLIPVQPSPYDVWACSDLVDLIQARREVTDGKPRAAFVISRAIKNTRLSRELDDALTEYGLPVFKRGTVQRVVYAESAAQGLTPMDKDPNSEASFEISQLVKELIRFAHEEDSHAESQVQA